MSYIDSFDHELIGRLGYLPLYRPLEVIAGEVWGGYDFSASPDNLILGGGSGEHPGLVVHHLPALVTRFLYAQLNDADEERLSAEDKAFVDDLYFTSDTLEFCRWQIADYANLHKMAQSEAFMTPLSEEMTVEAWLERSLGELIWYALPELNRHHSKLQQIFAPFHIVPTMRNIAIEPPGYPPSGGRTTENGRLKWGNVRWSKRV
ncbi:hypothetical protein [Kosakonia quasisacchari]|uniref:hypothetical protein n=1 Tax=Kosakonia quasisacchari TaxID=2529380 RepID=UPI0039E1255C